MTKKGEGLIGKMLGDKKFRVIKMQTGLMININDKCDKLKMTNFAKLRYSIIVMRILIEKV
uniref:Uncharacterized protein n=1 Tax=Onchocerca volvulus TaxID=6282 RepID=A0A8R1TZ18_ONCVO